MKSSLVSFFCLFLLIVIGFQFSGCVDKKTSSAARDGVVQKPQRPIRSRKNLFSVQMRWDLPIVAGNSARNSGVLEFKSINGKAPKEILVHGFHPKMPEHGHGTYEDEQTLAVDKAVPYRVSVRGVVFVMAGPPKSWIVEVDATVDGKRDVAVLEVDQEITENEDAR